MSFFCLQYNVLKVGYRLFDIYNATSVCVFGQEQKYSGKCPLRRSCNKDQN